MTSPTQIIKYANRTEFRNVGYSLKPEEQLGLPGSMLRNPILAQVFRDIHYAEGKGTGIGTMRDEMKKANLSVPLIESDRSSNLFVLTLLPHHLFDKEDIRWLQSFKQNNLTDEEARTLIVIREKGSISNAEYRTINGVDTLTASSHLRRLRDLGLLEQKGRGNMTFYVPTHQLYTPGISELAPGMPEDLLKELKEIGKRTSTQKIRVAILRLCSIKPFKLPELVEIIQRDADHLRKRYISKMVDDEELEYLFPESPNHPQQAYRTKNEPKTEVNTLFL